MNRSVVVVPVERATDVARIVRVATAIAASPVDVHLVQVMTADGLWSMEQEWRGPAAWSPDKEAPASRRRGHPNRPRARKGRGHHPGVCATCRRPRNHCRTRLRHASHLAECRSCQAPESIVPGAGARVARAGPCSRPSCPWRDPPRRRRGGFQRGIRRCPENGCGSRAST